MTEEEQSQCQEESLTEPSVPEFAEESSACAICYAYQVDPYSPTYLSRGDKIFEIDNKNDISISCHETIELKLQYSDSDFTAAHWVANKMKIGAHFKAFSGAASMAVEQIEASKYHTVRVDAIAVCTQECITAKGNFRTHPENHLTEDFKLAIKDLSVQEIESKIGVFYAVKVELGGMFQRSYVMEATEDDNESTITAELKSAFGKDCLGVSAEADAAFESNRRTVNRHAKVRQEWKAEGGNIDLWLQVGTSVSNGSGSSSAAEIAQEWAKTIDPSNVYPLNFELRPVWELIGDVDKEKGEQFKRYLEDKWEKDGNRHIPWKFRKAKLRVAKLPEASKTFILNACRTHISTLLEESIKAQSYLDRAMFFMDKTRLTRWQESANSGKKEAEDVQYTVCYNPDITAENLIDKLETQSQQHYLESQRYLGLWGNDSMDSNKVEKCSKVFLDKIITRLNIDINRDVGEEESWSDDLSECQLKLNEAMKWFDENLIKRLTPEKRKQNAISAIEQVKSIQELVTKFSKRLDREKDVSREPRYSFLGRRWSALVAYFD